MDNILTDQEKNEGYKLLFDGKTMAGWRTYQNKVSTSWSVKDGSLYCNGTSANEGTVRADLITIEQFENFDFSGDWIISPLGNSGIIYLASEEFPASHLSGPEFQIIDDKSFPELQDTQKTGANYAMHPAPEAEPKPVGEWNTARIVVNKGRVGHWLNGKRVVEYEIGSEDWGRRKMEGKWKDAIGYGMTKKGHIVLQDHMSEVWFKNIKIKEL